MRRILLILCIVLGSVLRIIALDKLPAGFTPDEASFGYNAYSLIATGKDEWGVPWYQLWVNNLRSFGDFKLPLYAFLVVPSVKLFGLNEFAVRLPNAVLGTLSIAVLYLLTKRLTGSSKTAVIAALLLAVSPWHISLSRGAFEANLVTFFLPLGILFYLSNQAVLSAFSLAAGFYSYHSGRFLSPLIAVILLVVFKDLKIKKLLFAVFFLVLCLPGIFGLVFSEGGSRVSDIGIFSPTDNWAAVSAQRFFVRNSGVPDFIARLTYNKPLFFVSQFTSNLLSYFSPQFLFTQGAAEATYGMLPGRGVVYYPEALFLLAFLLLLIKTPSRSSKLIIFMIILAAVPAALSKGPGYAANRAAAMIPFLVMASAIGLNYLLSKISAWVIILVMTVFFAGFLMDYYIYSPFVSAQAMLYGRGEMIHRLVALSGNYSVVKVSRSLSEPHIYLAFYSKYSPKEYQLASQSWLKYEKLGFKFLDQYSGYSLGKYYFGDIHPTDPVDSPVLFAGLPKDFPPDYPEYFHIDYPNGQTAVIVAASKSQ